MVENVFSNVGVFYHSMGHKMGHFRWEMVFPSIEHKTFPFHRKHNDWLVVIAHRESSPLDCWLRIPPAIQRGGGNPSFLIEVRLRMSDSESSLSRGKTHTNSHNSPKMPWLLVYCLNHKNYKFTQKKGQFDASRNPKNTQKHEPAGPAGPGRIISSRSTWATWRMPWACWKVSRRNAALAIEKWWVEHGWIMRKRVV